MSGHYDHALAHVHSVAYTDRLRDALPWLLDRIRESGWDGPPALHDLGCGDGTLIAAAREAGLRAGGSDISPAFVTRARERGLRVSLAPARMGPWPPETTALTAIGEVLSYLDGDEPGFGPTVALAAGTLPRGGILIADLVGPGIAGGVHDRRGAGWALASTTEIDGETLTRRIEIATSEGAEQAEHKLRILHPDRVAEDLDGLGFDTHLLAGYGDTPLPDGRFGILARRR